MLVSTMRKSGIWNRLITYPDTTFHSAYPSALDLKNIVNLGNSGKSGVGEAGNETRTAKDAGVDVHNIYRLFRGRGNKYLHDLRWLGLDSRGYQPWLLLLLFANSRRRFLPINGAFTNIRF